MMTPFKAFKWELIDREKWFDLDRLFHLFLKAETYSDIIQAVRFNANIEWAIDNGTLTEEILSKIPSLALESENIFNDTRTIVNPSKSIYIREGGNVTVILSKDVRAKIILLGGQLRLNTSDQSMAEVETYNDSKIFAFCIGQSYIYLSTYHYSSVTLNLEVKAICKLHALRNSVTTIDINDDSFVNAVVEGDSYLKLTGRIRNSKVRKHENGRVSKQIK